MKNLKLEDRISANYALLFLVLILVSNIILVYSLQRQSNKVRELSASNKMDEINSFLDKVGIFSDKTNVLTLDFNPEIIEGKKVIHVKPFNPGEDNYLYVLEIKQNKDSVIPINTLGDTDTEEASMTNEKMVNLLESFHLEDNDSEGKIINIEKNKYFVFKVSREIKNYKFNIYTLKNVTQENQIYKRLEYLVILFTIIGVVITIIVSKIMSRRILKPINNVIKTAKSISTDDLSKRIEIPKEEDELQNLTLIINEMLDRLETSFENQTKFVSDASHELRTPLAIIKGYAEIIRKRGTTDIDIFVESIDSIISETDNMRNLIQKLLFLAKGEITKINTKFIDIDANEMVHQIHSDTVVSTKTHNFHLEMGEDYKIKGDETLLQQAIRALIENAAKYSEPHTNIYIKSFIKDGFGRISIRDEGVGISEEDAKRIFDRFYRVDLSRTKATGGTGLGLAIVKRIVEIHNGKIEIDSKMNEGTEISIVLPIGNTAATAPEETAKTAKKDKSEKKAVFNFLKKEREKENKRKKKKIGRKYNG
ncbi:HAMP domain-containing sensor histidine kinase [Leptotrichia sp. oral taxon 223]|uniref:sensor histidine kinase n=1 Tax=Leptotrichia sp. oral taxon 223 TaxID=712363 RepID=UPI0015BC36AF|nr:HAMP domain-containing sensor histidine kinase [Leptotrichia sp. oral taxon 223]NWO18642.1 HAMP domain-containing protein [Leptotrichia sp. oral taxon 223]